jgi:DNA/RNA-binding domain of Phe-tRNA-synthetase-like protein
MLRISELWKEAYPEACVGLMSIQHVINPKYSPELTHPKQALENELKATFLSRADLIENPTIKAYSNYYKRFTKTYHVLQQLESILFKDKAIPDMPGLVQAMFMAELKNGLLTAGHDCAMLKGPLVLDLATGNEQYILINGKEQNTKPGDMLIKDSTGVISSIIHGPDARSRLSLTTQSVIFVVYAPAGIPRGSVQKHLSDIHAYVQRFSPEAQVSSTDIYS